MRTDLRVPFCVEGATTPLSTPFRQLLGSLLHICNHTRPDCSYAIGYLGRFAAAPVEAHFTALKRVAQYISNTKTRGIQFRGSVPNPLLLTGYVDANWIGKKNQVDPQSRSTGGYCFFLAGGLVSWKSKVQDRPTLSSTESEILAACEGARETIWLRNVLCELGFEQKEPTIVYEDNKGCQETIENGSLREPLKHILLREHYVLWAQEAQHLKIVRVDTHNQIADIFTKPLPPKLHDSLSSRFMIMGE
jgi:hypothetical protein